MGHLQDPGIHRGTDCEQTALLPVHYQPLEGDREKVQCNSWWYDSTANYSCGSPGLGLWVGLVGVARYFSTAIGIPFRLVHCYSKDWPSVLVYFHFLCGRGKIASLFLSGSFPCSFQGSFPGSLLGLFPGSFLAQAHSQAHSKAYSQAHY